ncbi:transcription initiation at TATA-containing promoter protein [Collariella sp. IMI 366227]|nr:transcription initiation at TATA-containing promoter protein [Collariella sp. IMI 366227]
MTTQHSEGALLNEKPSRPRCPPERKNQVAFSANRSLSAEPKPVDEPADNAPAESKDEPDHDIASGLDKVNMEDSAAPTDADMPDAPVERAEKDRSEPLSPKSQPKPEPETLAERSDEAQNKDAAAAQKAKDDVLMEDMEKGPDRLSTIPEERTQKTATSNATPVTPLPAIDDSRTSPIDGTTTTPPISATADTSMSELAPPSAKVSRERDIDSEDEPVAKRTKVEHGGGQAQAKRAAQEDRMDVDQKTEGGLASLYLPSGEPKKLNHESLNNNPITDWQNKQMRQVLAGVKKTKAGALFRLPVSQLWPGLWADYSAKVSVPMDISTMEKRLRGDGSSYATIGDFKGDMDLMVSNSIAFNGEFHDVTNAAKTARESILSRLALCNAAPPPKPEKKETVKAPTTRHVEPRAHALPLNTAPVARPKPPATSPFHKVPESPAFALPPGSNGVPLIRRDSNKPESRNKRPVKPVHSKDLVYDTKRKKKLPLELRFCDEVLTELRKTKNYDINAAFMHPVDPVALNIPTYHKVIKRPMDLGTMANKLGSGEYQTIKEFEKDFDLIIKNCKLFNGEEHIIYSQALRLQDLYRAEMSKKDEWIAKHAPVVPAASHGAAGGHDSDSDSAESEPEPEDEDRKQIEHKMANVQKRLDQEQKKVNDLINSGTADMSEVEISQSVVAMLQRQLMTERQKLSNLPKKVSKPKPSKPKKAGGAGGLPSKKASVPSAGAALAASKKNAHKKAPPKRKVGALEKEIITERLGDLNGMLLERAIDLIKKDTSQSENDAGELELDIDVVSEPTLIKLYDIVTQAFPNARAEKERAYAPAPAPSPPVAARPTSKAPGAKNKKNKPMSKSEQERRIQQLNELRAQATRQASGSQEPMESIEGNGLEHAAAAAQLDHESEHESEDSEED